MRKEAGPKKKEDLLYDSVNVILFLENASQSVVAESRLVIAWKEDRGRDYQGHRKTLGVMELVSVLIALIFSWVYMCPNLSNYFKLVPFLLCTSGLIKAVVLCQPRGHVAGSVGGPLSPRSLGSRL